MISEFQELSDKIDQLAAMTQTLRRENAQLRQANAALVVESIGYQKRLSEAAGRVEALLQQVPALHEPAAGETAAGAPAAGAAAPATPAPATHLPESEAAQ